jgi:hypothetical protein
MEDQVRQGWRKSSHSGNGGGDCVEVGHICEEILVRDTKDRTGPVLRFSPAVWHRFAGQVKRSLAPSTHPTCQGRTGADPCRRPPCTTATRGSSRPAASTPTRTSTRPSARISGGSPGRKTPRASWLDATLDLPELTRLAAARIQHLTGRQDIRGAV